jgi:exopolysaccharide production protein ExoY
MSLVGPRPLVQKEVDALPWPAWVTRYRVQPGITGLWQVSGRNNTTDTERLQLDIDYVRNWSLLQDLKIMIKTVPAIIFGRGAY